MNVLIVAEAVIVAVIALLLLGVPIFFGIILFRVRLYGGIMAIIFPQMYDRKEE